MNAQQLMDAVRVRVGIRAGDGLFTDDVMLTLVDQANSMIEAEKDWPWRHTTGTFETISGIRGYPLADFGLYDFYDADYGDDYDPENGDSAAGTWLRTLEVRVDGQGPCVEQTRTALDASNPDGVGGSPTAFAIDGGLLYLSPTPDAVYTVHHRFVTEVAPLSSPTSSPQMPAHLQWSIVQQATALAFTRAGDDQRAAVADSAMDRWRRRMVKELRSSKGPMLPRIRSGSGR